MTRLFEDGFELGNLSLWNNTIIANGTVTVDTLHPYNGSYAAHFVTNPTLLATNALAVKTIVASEVYVRAYILVNQGIAQMGTWDRFYFINIMATDGSYIAGVGLRREGTAPSVPLRWALWSRGLSTHSAFGANIDQTATPQVHCVELHYKKATGLYEVFVDGVLMITVTAPAVAPAVDVDVGAVQFGIQKSGPTGQGYDPTGQYTIEVFGDDFVIADSYIGPIVVPTNPKLTVNSSPELNVPVYVDDQLVGSTPIIVELLSGTHTVRVEKEVQR